VFVFTFTFVFAFSFSFVMLCGGGCDACVMLWKGCNAWVSILLYLRVLHCWSESSVLLHEGVAEGEMSGVAFWVCVTVGILVMAGCIVLYCLCWVCLGRV